MNIFPSVYLITISVVAFCFGCSKQNAGSNWKTFRSEEGEFSVLFPGVPKEEIRNTKPFPAHMFIYKVDETTSYVVTYCDVPEQPDPRGPHKIFEDARETILGKDGKPLQEVPIVLNGYSGREMEWEPNYANKKYGEAFAIAHFFVTKKHFYEVFAGMPTQDRFSTNYWHFLNSFKLETKKF